MKLVKFIISSFIWFGLFLPMVLLSLVVVPLMLLTEWDGTTTWFGNWKYGRGDTHYKAPSNGEYWKQLRFLCIRNPVSNFGKQVLSVKNHQWVWLEDKQIIGNFHWKYGWKDPVPENDNLRTFVYRPWKHD